MTDPIEPPEDFRENKAIWSCWNKIEEGKLADVQTYEGEEATVDGGDQASADDVSDSDDDDTVEGEFREV